MGVDAQMLVKTRGDFSPQQVRRLSVDLCEAFGADAFFMQRPGEWDDTPPTGQHALEIVEKYEQDGDDILPATGEQFIEVHLSGRYYGEGYERGDLPKLIAIAEWLEHRIPDAEIFYGGDSDGICAEPFDKAARAELFAHFAKVGHRPYRGGFGSVFAKGYAPICKFCDYAMVNYGGGQGTEFYGCDGCGQKVVRFASGNITPVERGKDFFGVQEVVK